MLSVKDLATQDYLALIETVIFSHLVHDAQFFLYNHLQSQQVYDA